jgi:hypothetical protein
MPKRTKHIETDDDDESSIRMMCSLSRKGVTMQTVKIVWTDNVPSDESQEHLWLDGIPKEHETTARRVCSKLNEGLGDRQGAFHYVSEK